ncbi:HPF/RaiA family ribosome-associated protein [Oculatella sp. LEGE 06141]|uniref:HPF/RaiA family ribosome-associated protein n=1 Tax=Oculatella sp. LEGE 06141 TaxID=1828648 RepID=UPI0018811D9E|nr:HPF/RaiA family ribosome-associated protein [Oculatella sp. LEGE 06141]MBE9180091.1 HPF/RaiA family ribosome-associated protein [Oculatella sp. LEGE 06141]
MKVPPEITYRGVDKTAAIDALVNEKIAKLERVCDHISSCHIAIEKIHDRPKGGSPYRVRLDITVPPGHELAAESNPSPGDRNQYPELDVVVRDAFDKAWRQLRDLSKQQQEYDKGQVNDGGHDTTALVTKLFPEQDYGFIKTLEGEDVYFHRNSVLHDDFDRLNVGTGVRFEAVADEEGMLHASTVQIVNKSGASVGKAEETLIEPPLGWE